MNDQRQTVREAAILIASLEQNLADKLLGRLSSTEAARAARWPLARLGEVDPDEQQTLVVQFRHRPGRESDIRGTREWYSKGPWPITSTPRPNRPRRPLRSGRFASCPTPIRRPLSRSSNENTAKPPPSSYRTCHRSTRHKSCRPASGHASRRRPAAGQPRYGGRRESAGCCP